MQEAFHHGGWGMYPTTIVGAILGVLAWRFALNPVRTRLPLLIGLNVLTMFVASLGFIAGLIRSTTAAAEMPNAGNLVLAGFGESLNNIGLGVGMCIVAMIGVCVGLGRQRPATTGGSLVDPLRG